MKLFRCDCGQEVYFESRRCVNCGTILGFDSNDLQMRSLTERENGDLLDAHGRAFRICENGSKHDVCNWLVPANEGISLCFGCGFNRTIPDLSNPLNLKRWSRLENSKKRLFFTLLTLKLPLRSGHDSPEDGLVFDFVEDSRTNSHRYPETFVSTGYKSGVITINVLEADDVAREAVKVELGESYRTVLGHLRHESGHYYWTLFSPTPDESNESQRLFGDMTSDYSGAIESYYQDGPAPDWSERCISPYASSHPVEDWAESWGHYLQIYDVLETAAAHGAAASAPGEVEIETRLADWRSLSITLNELNRSVGIGDAYPFVINRAVEEKLIFVDAVIRRLGRPG